MKKYTLETLYYDTKLSNRFFVEYDKLIAHCKKFGFLKAAREHAANRKRIFEELELLKA